MALIRQVEGDALDRAAWAMAYFGRTLYFNGPRTEREARAFLGQPESFASRNALEALIASASDPVQELLSRFLATAYLHRATSEQAIKRAEWRYKEATLNARLRLAFAVLEPEQLALWREVIPNVSSCHSLKLAEITRLDDNKPRYGTPDILLKGDNLVVLIEMKTRGVPSRHLYDLEQLVKYLNLVQDERQTWTHPSEFQIAHVLLRPQQGGRIVRHRKLWFVAPEDGGRVVLRDEDIQMVAAKTNWKAQHDHKRALRTVVDVPVYERTYTDIISAMPSVTHPLNQLAFAQLTMLVADAEPRVS